MLNTYLPAEEHRVVLEKGREANRLHNESPQNLGLPEASMAIATTHLRRHVNHGDLAKREHYQEWVPVGRRKGAPRGMSVSPAAKAMTRGEHLGILRMDLGGLSPIYGCGLEASENSKVVNMVFMTLSAPDIQRKLHRVQGAWNAGGTVSRSCFKVFHN